MSKLLDNTVILDLTVHRPGLRRQVKQAEVDVQAVKPEGGDEGTGGNGKPDQSFVHVGKDILRSSAIVELNAIVRNLKQRIGVRALPSPLKRGTYLIPLNTLEEVYSDCEATKVRWQAVVDQFVAEYPARVEEARERLGDMFKENDYPPAAKIRQAFGLDWVLLEFKMPGESKLGEFVFAKESAAAAERIRSAEMEVISALEVGLLELVSGLSDALDDKPGEKKKVLRDARVEKAVEFLDHFGDRNVMNDADLMALAEEAKAVLGGRSADSLRKNQSLREHVQKGMAEVAGKLEALATSRPGRKFKVD